MPDGWSGAAHAVARLKHTSIKVSEGVVEVAEQEGALQRLLELGSDLLGQRWQDLGRPPGSL